jgi:2-methylisocitrate lyase-like PEP mutase family enzyme
VQRISIGTSLAQIAYSAAQRAARDLLTTGTINPLASIVGFADLNRLFTDRT